MSSVESTADDVLALPADIEPGHTVEQTIHRVPPSGVDPRLNHRWSTWRSHIEIRQGALATVFQIASAGLGRV